MATLYMMTVIMSRLKKQNVFIVVFHFFIRFEDGLKQATEKLKIHTLTVVLKRITVV